MSDYKTILTNIGKNLPDRQRVKATKTVSIRMEPQGTIRVTHAIDTFLDGKVDTSKNNLEGKKLVLLFGQESNYLTRAFLTPKMSAIYQHMTTSRDDVEFLFVGLEGQSKVEYERFAASMRKYLFASVFGRNVWISFAFSHPRFCICIDALF